MLTKLTLTIEKSVIEKAKAYAKKTGRSLPELIENYLEIIAQDNSDLKMSRKLKGIAGAVKLPVNFNEKKERLSYLERKHLRKRSS